MIREHEFRGNDTCTYKYYQTPCGLPREYHESQGTENPRRSEMQNPAEVVTPMAKALGAVVAYCNEISYAKTALSKYLTTEDVKLVWFSKTLENWKALVITTLPDQLYYEVTYSGQNKDTCIDVYQKIDSVRVYDEAVEEQLPDPSV
jgi:hypothetical protein